MTSILSDSRSIFDHFEKLTLDGVKFNTTTDHPSMYVPYVRQGKIKSIKLNLWGTPGGLLESSAHEVAHWIDLARRNKLQLLLKRNYGMSFEIPNIIPGYLTKPTPAAKDKMIWGLRNEIKVFIIEAKLFHMCEFKWNNIYDVLAELLSQLGNIDYMSEALNFHIERFKNKATNKLLSPKRVIAAAKEIKTDAILEDWSKVKEMFA